MNVRPLADGLPAVPLATSGRDGVKPKTSVNLGELGGPSDSAFADQQILDELRQGFSDDSQCKRGTLLCAPHGSALECYDIVREKLQKNTDEGWVSSGYDLPCWPLRTYPVGVVDESERAGRPKFRLASDLSWPRPYTMPDGNGGFVDSVNDAMRREAWPDNRLIKVREVALCRRSLRSLRSLRSQGQQSFARSVQS